ncbi:hypothetical protein [Acidianus ambivalens]|uniref:Uncharacterized protein n=1 Tax=Acidianus ambivalens TaxID=2283 RepID=A0A650CX04_ACIAM|nr:hypothetical protein [Acidianus ambivalens]MQL54337.1 hypothetical protein [Acidianus ambivalens]QGR22162.1 hypothetical protein D1866_09355 [Acidianus ambivalens]
MYFKVYDNYIEIKTGKNEVLEATRLKVCYENNMWRNSRLKPYSIKFTVNYPEKKYVMIGITPEDLLKL